MEFLSTVLSFSRWSAVGPGWAGCWPPADLVEYISYQQRRNGSSEEWESSFGKGQAQIAPSRGCCLVPVAQMLNSNEPFLASDC